MSNTFYKRREFLEPYTDSQTAYVYAYIDTWQQKRDYRTDKKLATPKRHYSSEFGLHDGNDTLHLHIEEARRGQKGYFDTRDVAKLRKLASVATELADKLEKLK